MWDFIWLALRFGIGSGQKIRLLHLHVHCTTKLDGCTCTHHASAIFAELCLPRVHVSICRRLPLLLYVVLLSPSLGNGLYKPTIQLNQLALIELIFPSSPLSTDQPITEHVFPAKLQYMNRAVAYGPYCQLYYIYVAHKHNIVLFVTYCSNMLRL